jgi:hypothetical protein
MVHGTLYVIDSIGFVLAAAAAIMHLTEQRICGMVRIIGADHVRLDQSGIY